MQTPLSSASFAPLVSLEEDGGGASEGADGSDGETSFDPSVVMAQAYQKEKNKDREQVWEMSNLVHHVSWSWPFFAFCFFLLFKAPTEKQQGPLAFLGLQQRKTSGEEEEEEEEEQSNTKKEEGSVDVV